MDSLYNICISAIELPPRPKNVVVENAVKLLWRNGIFVPDGTIDDVRAEPLPDAYLASQSLFSQASSTNDGPSPMKTARRGILRLNVSFEKEHPVTISTMELVLAAMDERLKEFGGNSKVICLTTTSIVGYNSL
jgi:hypothetical protein